MLLIYILHSLYIRIVVFSAPVPGFPIKNCLVISCTINIMGLANREKTRSANAKMLADAETPADADKLADTETPADVKTLADVEKKADKKEEELANVKEGALTDIERGRLANAEENALADVEKFVVIYYKH